MSEVVFAPQFRLHYDNDSLGLIDEIEEGVFAWYICGTTLGAEVLREIAEKLDELNREG
jgi:hypothetical protein